MRKSPLLLLLFTMTLAAGPACLAEETSKTDSVDGSRYLCQPLDQALTDLENHGLSLIYSSDLVRPGLQVKETPTGPVTPRTLLDALLQPHGLMAHSAAGGRLLVVPAPGYSRPSSRQPESTDHQGPIPAWTTVMAQENELVQIDFPPSAGQPEIEIPPQTRYLILRLQPHKLRDPAQDAFLLKDLIVAARSAAPEAKIALEGPWKAVDRIVSRGLAPYIEAYVVDGLAEDEDPAAESTSAQPSAQPFRPPSADPTARSWWRTRGQGPNVLARLLEGSARGDQLVVLEGMPIDPLHRAFLHHVAQTPSAPLEVQPHVQGSAPGHTFFFLDPERDAHYLAVYANGEESQRLRFDLHRQLEIQSLFPQGANFRREGFGTSTELLLTGGSPFYLFELVPQRKDAVFSDVLVNAGLLVDPYEEVVKNQVFQRREREKFQSLDVLEFLSITSSNPAADQITWEHRIIERKGHFTDYHHLGLLRNGVRVPQDRLLKGRIFRSEALLQLRPLEIELDETYRYRFLGSEEIDGHATWKIGFEPLQAGSSQDGTFVSGVVWLDQRTRAHRRMRTFQRGLEGRVVSVERTLHYNWIPSSGECYWDWRRREGRSVVSFLGQQVTNRLETLRHDFHFNRPDIDEEVRRAYASDILIHVETPPAGHRWLVKRDGRRHLGEFTHGHGPLNDSPEGEGALRLALLETSNSPAPQYGERELADIHAFSTRTSFSLGGFGSEDESFELFPGLVVTDTDLFDRGYNAYLGLFRREAILALGLPNAFSNGGKKRGIHFDAHLRLPYQDRIQGREFIDFDGTFHLLDVDTWQPTLTLASTFSLNRHFTLTTAYLLRQLRFSPTADTDPEFILPSDTLEHGLDTTLRFGRRSVTVGIGLEVGHRATWETWGLRGMAPLHADYQVWSAQSSWFKRLGERRSLALELDYFKGFDLDRFSRLPEGRARLPVAGFLAGVGADEALRLRMGHGFRVGRFPMHLRLDLSRQRLPTDLWRDLVGVRARFLVHGPFRLDLWPSIGYGLYSSDSEEEGHVVFGLAIERRQ